MNQLRKYVEWMSRGRRTNRTAYVIKEWDLPLPLPGAEWQLDPKILNNPDLKAVFKEVLEQGVALRSVPNPGFDE